MIPLKKIHIVITILAPLNAFSPIAKIASLKIMITLTITHNLHIHQMDVKTTFLNGTPNEKITCFNQKALFTQIT
jgi:hypothetical protein